jgi:nitrite reductase/ring-hydroxylating ferredoxin subunit
MATTTVDNLLWISSGVCLRDVPRDEGRREGVIALPGAVGSSGLRVEVGGRALILRRHEGALLAFDALCPHQGADLTSAIVASAPADVLLAGGGDAGVGVSLSPKDRPAPAASHLCITCPRHGLVYSGATGRGSHTFRLGVYPTRVGAAVPAAASARRFSDSPLAVLAVRARSPPALGSIMEHAAVLVNPSGPRGFGPRDGFGLPPRGAGASAFRVPRASDGVLEAARADSALDVGSSRRSSLSALIGQLTISAARHESAGTAAVASAVGAPGPARPSPALGGQAGSGRSSARSSPVSIAVVEDGEGGVGQAGDEDKFVYVGLPSGGLRFSGSGSFDF